MKFNTDVEIESEVVIGELANSKTNEEILDFIKELDGRIGEWKFTEMALEYFKAEMSEKIDDDGEVDNFEKS